MTEMPKCCPECDDVCYPPSYGRTPVCDIKHKIGATFDRPVWCPLVEIKENEK